MLTYLLGAFLQYFFLITIVSPVGRSISHIAGAMLFTIGAILAAWSLVIFHKAKTTTTPGEVSAALITRGPYSFSRNPMYISLIFAFIGEAGLLVQIIPVILLPLTIAYIQFIVIPVEETRLSEDYKELYREYCARVPRWL